MGERDDAVAVVYEAAVARAASFNDREIRQDAQDIAQMVVVRFLEVTDSATIQNSAGWANRVAGNIALNRIRARRHDAGPIDTDETTQTVEMFVAQGLMTSYQATLREQASRLISEMSDREAEIVARTVAGESQEEIAVAMGYAGPDSVKKTLSRLRARMKTRADETGLAQDWGDHPRAY